MYSSERSISATPHLGTSFPFFHGLNSVLNVKAVVATFNQEKALVGAFSVIVQLHRLIDLRHYQGAVISHESSAHAAQPPKS